MIAVGIEKADSFVGSLQRKGVNVLWDGWTMRFLSKDARAERDVNGIRQNGEWGFPVEVSANEAGKWLVDFKMTQGRKNAQRR